MKTMHVISKDNGIFLAISKDTYPCVAIVSDIRFHETEPLLQMEVDWVNKGKYSNRQRKKLLARTFKRLLEIAVKNIKK